MSKYICDNLQLTTCYPIQPCNPAQASLVAIHWFLGLCTHNHTIELISAKTLGPLCKGFDLCCANFWFIAKLFSKAFNLWYTIQSNVKIRYSICGATHFVTLDVCCKTIVWNVQYLVTVILFVMQSINYFQPIVQKYSSLSSNYLLKLSVSLQNASTSIMHYRSSSLQYSQKCAVWSS